MELSLLVSSLKTNFYAMCNFLSNLCGLMRSDVGILLDPLATNLKETTYYFPALLQ